jgi:hypothetical protein
MVPCDVIDDNGGSLILHGHSEGHSTRCLARSTVSLVNPVLKPASYLQILPTRQIADPVSECCARPSEMAQDHAQMQMMDANANVTVR